MIYQTVALANMVPMLSSAPGLSLAHVQAYRDQVYHRTPHRRLRTPDEAVRWLADVGFAFLFPMPDFEMPSLWQAVCGTVRPVPTHHHDADLGRVWDWKDSLPTQRRVFYAKLLRGKPMLVALDRAPLFYALTENYGDPHDYLAEYEAGTLSIEAKKVYEALLEVGQAASTGILRRVSGLEGKAHVARFDRAIAQLQRSMKIVKVGISDSNRWGYSYVYDVLPHVYPDIPAQAREIGRREAQRGLLRQYLQNVGAVPARPTLRLFDWDERTLDRLVGDLAVEGVTRGAVTGLGDDCLMHPRLFQ